MELRGTERRVSEHSENSEQVLATRYAQLMRWANALTRNDHAKAEEIVQEFCLYITLTKPDFRHVANLDGYLYTCLRHVYTSSLAKASRDALHLVSLEEYDSFALAVCAHTSGDALQRQNDLRRACAYAVWRKESSKTASYFILHFFHGYARQEVASVARVTMATVYNKLKTARSEVGAYLQDAGKLRIIDREEPPAPTLPWFVVPVSKLFAELRRTILGARLTDCLPEQALSALYDAAAQTPIPCELLAHIVSCERCLAVVDHMGRRPTLKDREPLDVFGYAPRDGEVTPGAEGGMARERMMEAVKRKWKRVYDHRPGRLSIALNGEVIATHDVRSEHNRLSARIESGVRAEFVEVFSEQGVRLALLPVEAAPPEMAAAQRVRIQLSDARWLELNLRFDGLGLESEVLYFDPALSPLLREEEEETPAIVARAAEPSRFSALIEGARQRLRVFAMPTMAWAFALLVAAGLGYWIEVNHRMPTQATAVLNDASQREREALRGQTEHQVVRLEERSPDGRVQVAATIDLWKDGDGGRYIRRLLDGKHQLLAVEWQGKGQGAQKKRALRRPDALLWQFWDQELSAQAFASIPDGQLKVRPIENRYEITKMGPAPGYPELVSTTLVLNYKYEAVEQRLQVQTSHGVRQLRFTRESFELKPARSVPDDTFAPTFETRAGSQSGRMLPGPRGFMPGDDVKRAELEIQILYALRLLNADTGVPIEVSRTPAGQVLVAGVVANDDLRRAITTRLRSLADTNLLELQIAVAGRAHGKPPSRLRSGPLESYEVSQNRFAADASVRRLLESRGLSGERLDRSVEQFSLDALARAQRALQHAYALDRLGRVVTGDELQSISKPSQRAWAKMVQDHASGVQNELRALQDQLAEVWPRESEAQKTRGTVTEIENRAQYGKAAQLLLEHMSELNQRMGELFTADGRAGDTADQRALLNAIMDAEKLYDSSRISEFATRLSDTADGKRAATTNE